MYVHLQRGWHLRNERIKASQKKTLRAAQLNGQLRDTTTRMPNAESSGPQTKKRPPLTPRFSKKERRMPQVSLCSETYAVCMPSRKGRSGSVPGETKPEKYSASFSRCIHTAQLSEHTFFFHKKQRENGCRVLKNIRRAVFPKALPWFGFGAGHPAPVMASCVLSPCKERSFQKETTALSISGFDMTGFSTILSAPSFHP